MGKINAVMAVVAFVMCLTTSTQSLAWGPQPIQNVVDAPISTSKPLTAAQVKTAIINAGIALGWRMVEISPGVIEGTLNVRKHVAVVETPYTATKFSILFKSAVNLNETDGKIHKQYNKWVKYLSDKIGLEVLRE